MKTYAFDYDMLAARAVFNVNPEVFTKTAAQAEMSAHLWEIDPEINIVEQVIKKYAMIAIKIASIFELNASAVVKEFDDLKGYYSIGGTHGILLTEIQGFEYDEELLERAG